MVKAQERAKAAAHWTECEARYQEALKAVSALNTMPDRRKGALVVEPNEAALAEAKAKVKLAALEVAEAAEAFQRTCRA